MIKWKPIETAPTSGEPVLGSNGVTVASIRWSDETSGWETVDALTPFSAVAWDEHPEEPTVSVIKGPWPTPIGDNDD
jgi:hypothetical protein